MRLWHKDLIPYLPKSQLLGQHRECCAMRGLGWGKNSYVVNYVWRYNYVTLFIFHRMVMHEMKRRKYNVTTEWYRDTYRGKKIKRQHTYFIPNILKFHSYYYKEHNDEYLSICLHNLKYSISDATKKSKGIDLFKYFPNIKDLGYSLDTYEKQLRSK